MPVILYMAPMSPPARAALITAEALAVPLEVKVVDLANGEHLQPEFQKLNPQHTVPVLDDNGTIIWDSHAICAYLVGKYGKNDELYPKDLAKRAVVDQRLHFDTGMVFSTLRLIMISLLFKGAKSISVELGNQAEEAYDFLEKFLQNSTWIAGDSPTIADISLLTTLSNLSVLVPINKRFSGLLRWIQRGNTLSYFEKNQPGLEEFKKLVPKLLQL